MLITATIFSHIGTAIWLCISIVLALMAKRKVTGTTIK